jgi:hypothetical protein
MQSSHKLPTVSSRVIVTVYFLALTALGLLIFRDYGFATDEHINRENGGVSLRYILSIIEQLLGINIQWAKSSLSEFHRDLFTYKDRDYGVAFDLPVMVIERLFQVDSSRDQYLLRHFLTYLIFVSGLISFYLIVKTRFSDWRIGVLATTFMACSPRIFAEAFYNNKDIVFMSLFITAIYHSLRMIDTPTVRNCFWAALFSALAIDVRIIAVVIPLIVVAAFILKVLRNDLNRKHQLHFLAGYLALTACFTISFWPWLWTNPMGHFTEAMRNMAQFRWLNWVLYRGHYYPSTNLPWHYLPVWIVITTPILYLLLTAIGVCAILKTALVNKFRLWCTEYELQDLIFISILVAPIAAAVLLKSTVYDGWRQFYFIYPALIYIAMRGFVIVWSFCRAMKFPKFAVFILLISSLAVTTFWMIRNHPYQHIYFNRLAGPAWVTQYEGDYWGLTNTKGLDFIARTDPRAQVSIYNIGNTSIPQAFLLLPDNTKSRFKVTTSVTEANYAITNFRFLNRLDAQNLYDEISSKFPIVYEVQVDGMTVLAVFKLR